MREVQRHLQQQRPPTIPSVARDPAVRKVNPWLKPEIANVARVTRPTVAGREVPAGLADIYQGVNQILNGQDAKNVLPGIEQRLNRLLPDSERDSRTNEDGGVSAPILVVRRASHDEHDSADTRCGGHDPAATAVDARLQRKQTRLAWLMLMPALALVALVAIYPLGADDLRQLHEPSSSSSGSQPIEFVGLRELPLPPRRHDLPRLDRRHGQVHGHHGRLRVRARHDHRARRQLRLQGAGRDARR